MTGKVSVLRSPSSDLVVDLVPREAVARPITSCLSTIRELARLLITSAFSMSRSLEPRFVFGFSFHRAFAFALVGVATHVVLHRVSIRTLGELV